MGVNKLADLIEKKRKAQKLDAVEEKAAKSHKDAIASSPAQTQVHIFLSRDKALRHLQPLTTQILKFVLTASLLCLHIPTDSCSSYDISHSAWRQNLDQLSGKSSQLYTAKWETETHNDRSTAEDLRLETS